MKAERTERQALREEKLLADAWLDTMTTE